jgi:hypothetical protein
MASLEALGEDIIAAIGVGAARELLDAITRPEAERAALIGRLASRDNGNWLADLLSDLEVDEVARLQVISALTLACFPGRTA